MMEFTFPGSFERQPQWPSDFLLKINLNTMANALREASDHPCASARETRLGVALNRNLLAHFLESLLLESDVLFL
jgi:hypothetical protein